MSAIENIYMPIKDVPMLRRAKNLLASYGIYHFSLDNDTIFRITEKDLSEGRTDQDEVFSGLLISNLSHEPTFSRIFSDELYDMCLRIEKGEVIQITSFHELFSIMNKVNGSYYPDLPMEIK